MLRRGRRRRRRCCCCCCCSCCCCWWRKRRRRICLKFLVDRHLFRGRRQRANWGSDFVGGWSKAYAHCTVGVCAWTTSLSFPPFLLLLLLLLLLVPMLCSSLLLFSSLKYFFFLAFWCLRCPASRNSVGFSEDSLLLEPFSTLLSI